MHTAIHRLKIKLYNLKQVCPFKWKTSEAQILLKSKVYEKYTGTGTYSETPDILFKYDKATISRKVGGNKIYPVRIYFVKYIFIRRFIPFIKKEQECLHITFKMPSEKKYKRKEDIIWKVFPEETYKETIKRLKQYLKLNGIEVKGK